MSKNNRRQGAAIVELAVCLPILILITVGTISSTSIIFLKQSLKIAAYEGARVAIVPGAESGSVVAEVQSILSQRSVTGAVIDVTPDVRSSSQGTTITVTIDAPASGNGFFIETFFSGRSFSESVSVMKEY
ncbi:MAG: TadE family protein [Planctomycetota bacterium]